MHKIKRVWRVLGSFIICWALAASFLPAVADVEESDTETRSGSCGTNAAWTLEEGTLTISGSGAMTDYSEGNLAPWYSYRKSIQTLVVTDGITHIGNLSFYQCSALTAVVLPESVVSIGNIAFSQCTGLYTVSFGSALTSIGRSAFEECTSLVAVRLPLSLISLGERAFFRCASLGGVVLPESATDLGAMVFAYCTGLCSATIRGSITQLPYWFFYGCTSLTAVYLPDTLETIGNRALGGCSCLATVDCGSAADGVQNAISEALSASTETYTGKISNKEYFLTDSVDITVSQTTYEYTNNGELIPDEVVVSAVIEDDNGWEELADKTTKLDSSASVDAYCSGTALSEDILSFFYGQEAVLTVHTQQNTVWQIALADQTEKALSAEQDFSVSVKKNESVSPQWKEEIGETDSFTVTIGNNTLNTTAYIPVGTENAGRIATLYSVKEGKLEALGSTVVSGAGTAAFSLQEAGGKYVIALDADGVSLTEAVLSQDLYEQYGGEVTLTDGDGNFYIVTGTTNSFPVTLFQLALIIGSIVTVLTVVIVVVMSQQNRKKQIEEYMKKRNEC